MQLGKPIKLACRSLQLQYDLGYLKCCTTYTNLTLTCNSSFFLMKVKIIIFLIDGFQVPLFWLQKWIQLGHVSQVANFWFSSHNFGEVAVIQTFQYFQVVKRVLHEAAKNCWMTWAYHPTCPPHTKLSLILEILKFLNYSYFAKIMTTESQKLATWLTWPSSEYSFLVSKKWHRSTI